MLRKLQFCLFLLWILSCKKDEPKLFVKLDPTFSHVDFQNKLTETPEFNILDYLYFYNGGGVSAGDINNDSLVDLFFVSNQGQSKLYLNKGLKDGKPFFEDITIKANVGGLANWKTGSTMADVNGDGLLDIYVCAVGNYKILKGGNELFINNGDLTFTEKSKEYGLAFEGFSTQSAFFDYDKDGDLDCFLLNHSVHNASSFDKVSIRNTVDRAAGDYLFRNDNGKFVDVSLKSGIYQAGIGYGLGLAVADINNDGWLDIYVSNDFHEDDYYYVNQKNGTFKEDVKNHFKHLSRFSMGNDVADINNDGFQDIMTLDMYPEDEKVEKSSVGEDPLDIFMYKLQFGYFRQYSRNCLQLNLDGEHFSDIAAMAGVVATDWSWSTLMADYDGDGIKDIFVANGIKRRPNDLDYLKYLETSASIYGDHNSKELDQEKLNKMPDGKVHNYIFKGTKDIVFQDKSIDWGFETPIISNGSAYADLDNDGDLDLITNNINEPASIYLNQSRNLIKSNYIKIQLKGADKNTFGIGAKVYIKTKDGEQMQQMMPTRGFMSSVEPKLIFGLGTNTQIDTLKVIWENQKMQVLPHPSINKLLVLDQKNALIDAKNFHEQKIIKPFFKDISAEINLDYVHKENEFLDFSREILMPNKVSIEGPKIAVGDVNGDGLEDFYVCGAKNQAGQLFIQKNERFVNSPQKVFLDDAILEGVDAVFFDADGDIDLDLYVVSGGNEYYRKMPEQLDRLYFNDGKGNFSLGNLPQMFDNKSCVRPFDFDKDGDLDLFVGGRVVPFQYGISPNSYLLQNNGKGIFSDVTDKYSKELRTVGMVTDAVWTDINKNGKPDLVTVGDWMGIRIFEFGNSKCEEIKTDLSEKTGFWNGISTSDFDKDGDVDFVIGNLGLNTKFLKQAQGSLKMYINDFDGNGSKEQILCYNRGSDWYPVNSKDELGKQMPGIINKRFVEYKEYAGKTIDQIFKKDELSHAIEKEINTFESVYIENLGNNKFKLSALPVMAQISKIMATQVTDVNHDGNLDLIIGGNFDGASMYQARYDGFYGLVLLGNGKGKFTSSNQNGFLCEGDIRDIETIKTPKRNLKLVARNNNTILVFQELK